MINTDTSIARHGYQGVYKASARDFGNVSGKVKFCWPAPVVEELAESANSTNQAIVLCGWSSNSHLFAGLTNRSVYLKAPLEERIRRLRIREPRRWQEGSRDYNALLSKSGKAASIKGFQVVESDDSIVSVCRAVLRAFRSAS